MSERKLKPASSRSQVAASTTLAGSTTIVVSRCFSTTSTRPGTESNSVKVPHGSRGDAPNLVRRRNARFDRFVQADDSLDQLLGTRRTARHVDVDRDDLVDRLHDRVVVE